MARQGQGLNRVRTIALSIGKNYGKIFLTPNMVDAVCMNCHENIKRPHCEYLLGYVYSNKSI